MCFASYKCDASVVWSRYFIVEDKPVRRSNLERKAIRNVGIVNAMLKL